MLEVEDAASRAIEAARSGEGPTFLEMKTFRRMQHSMRANLPDTRDPAVVAEWEPKDPLPRFENVLVELGQLEEEALAALRQGVEDEIAEAIRQAGEDEPAERG